MDEQTEERKSKNKTAREEEIKSGLLMGTPYQHYIFTHTNIRVFSRAKQKRVVDERGRMLRAGTVRLHRPHVSGAVLLRP
ncbi:MAG: hypothetical protein P4M11_08885 [Candidatus Pacebacteria bacterium]|nr:hypothetical protein [Candidatus Paceibacterota bacterium]